MKQLWIVVAASVAMLAACSKNDSSGGVTAEEAAGLNNAAEMLDASPDSLVATEETPLGNGDEAVPVIEGAVGNAAAR